MKIGHLDTNERVVIVAEIGLNHEDDYMVARQLVEEAADAGADAVKFQIYRHQNYADPSQIERYNWLIRCELSWQQHAALAKQAHFYGLAFIATPLDLESADLCIEICDAVKIASKDIDFWPLLERVVDSDVPLILSTGMSNVNRIRKVVDWVSCRQLERPALLHCVSGYPTPDAQAELRAISYLACMSCCEIGYSDHTIGLDAAPLAVALGARIIEKHFTLDHHFSDFRDHELSANPRELTELVRRIRCAEKLLGEPIKRVMPCEADTIAACARERAFRESVLTR